MHMVKEKRNYFSHQEILFSNVPWFFSLFLRSVLMFFPSAFSRMTISKSQLRLMCFSMNCFSIMIGMFHSFRCSWVFFFIFYFKKISIVQNNQNQNETEKSRRRRRKRKETTSNIHEVILESIDSPLHIVRESVFSSSPVVDA